MVALLPSHVLIVQRGICIGRNDHVQSMLKTGLYCSIDAEVGHNATDHHVFFALCCQEMRSLAELALVNKVADLPADKTVEQISSLFPKSKLVCVIDVCANMLDSIQSNLNGNLLITLFCAQLLTDQYGRI